MSTLSQWLLLLRVHWRMLRVKATDAAAHSRLMTGTIATFLLGYMVAAYWLFSEGLRYVASLPAAGALLGDRLIYVLFFCFFMMLVFSVAVTSYISLYRSRDTRWLLTLPVSHRALFLWKCFESAAFSSWGLAFILAPLLLAFARMRGVSPDFFLKTILVLLLFLIVASAIGAILLLTAVRWLNRKQILAGVIVVALLLVGSAVNTGLKDQRIVEESGLGSALTFQRVLHHTGIAVNRAIPSTWLAGSVVDWTRPFRHSTSVLYPTLLVSHSLFAVLLLIGAGDRWFYRSWNLSLQHSAVSAMRRDRQRVSDHERLTRLYPRPSWLARLIGRPLAAISRKDFLTFFREPAQWVQFSVVFGLLALYSTGLRKMNGDLGQPRDLYLVAFLNLSVCALALSTLTTRFVFPQFSLEGRRLWILAMSPLKLPSIVLQKFVTSTLCSGLIVIGILFIGGYNLRLGFADSTFFAGAIALLAMGLNGLAVGLGVLFPNLRESNAAKIVSGFGGTLCLVGSFIYILTFILLLAWLRWEVFRENAVDPGWYEEPAKQWGIAAILALTFFVTLAPLLFSQKKLKRLEILTNS
jgi:ABC-2 type transport system permease protein